MDVKARQPAGQRRQMLRMIDEPQLLLDLRVADIVLVPALLAMLAIGLGIARNRRRARARA